MKARMIGKIYIKRQQERPLSAHSQNKTKHTINGVWCNKQSTVSFF